MRRRVLLSGMLAAVTLSACGSDTGPPTQTAASRSDGPVEIAHKFGTATIDAAPQRVVAVGFNDQDFALALGVHPVGARQFQPGIDITDRPWAQTALGGRQPELIGAEELNFEQIAALHPDLILGIYSGITRKDYDLLAAIAPTVAQTDAYIDYGMPWEDQLRMTGEALGRADEAQRQIGAIHRRFASAKQQLGNAGRTYAFAAANGGQLYLYDDQDLRARFFASLGFTVPQAITNLTGASFYGQISGEQLDLLDQDLLVIYGRQADVRKIPGFDRLAVAREDRVIYLDPTGDLANALGFSSPLSLPYAIDGFVPRIDAAING